MRIETKQKPPREAWKGHFGMADNQGYASISKVLIEKLSDRVKEILLQVGQETLAEAKRTCPVRTGALQMSHGIKELDDRPAVVVYMGSKEAYYGKILHLKKNVHLTPPAVDKWFEKATEIGKRKVSRLMNIEMKKFFDAGTLHQENWEQLDLFKYREPKKK